MCRRDGFKMKDKLASFTVTRRSNLAWKCLWCSLGLLGLIPGAVFAQIESVTRLTAQPRQYERVDQVIMLKGIWNSPYRAEEIKLDLRLKSPSGKPVVVPAYFERGRSGAPSVWQSKFTPVETGDYRGNFELTNGGQVLRSAEILFTVAPSQKKGFLEPRDDWTFRFSNGEPFRGLGENICWESRDQDDSKFFRELHENPRFNYDYLLGTLAAHRGNFFRTWMCPWNLPLEWRRPANNSRYREVDDGYNDSAALRLDHLLELAAGLDLYVMLALNTASDFMGGDWEKSSYHVKNGGPATNSIQFFTDPQAGQQYKDRLRYLVARWGWSPNLGAWEFFNEIDNWMYSQTPRVPDAIVTAWHAEMSAYLKSIDPYRHLITTSVSHRDVAGLYSVATMDFNQRHFYGQTAKFSEAIRQQIRQAGKPFVIGEFSYEWDWSKNFDTFAERMDADFRKGLWSGLFSPTPILPMSWWWEYFDQRGQTKVFAQVRKLMDQMLAAGNGSFKDFSCAWQGPAVHPLGVRCGQSIFVLLQNNTTNTVTGSLTLNLPENSRASAYAAESDQFRTLSKFPAGATTVSELSIAPDHNLILIFSPE
jgi:hypothetical protein